MDPIVERISDGRLLRCQHRVIPLNEIPIIIGNFMILQLIFGVVQLDPLLVLLVGPQVLDPGFNLVLWDFIDLNIFQGCLNFIIIIKFPLE